MNSWKSAPCSTGYLQDADEICAAASCSGAGRLTMIDPVGEAARVGA